MNHKERFYFTAKGLHEVKFHVVRFTGTEKINAGFFFKILLIAKEHSLDPAALIYQTCIFSIMQESGKRVVYSGYCHEVVHEGSINGYIHISVDFVPFIYGAQMPSQSKIFLDKALPDLIKELMSEPKYIRVEYELRLKNKYPVQEFSMRYNENLYTYLLYKLEEQGVYFFMDEAGQKIIFADCPQSHDKSIGSFRYLPWNGLEHNNGEDVIHSFNVSMQKIPGRVVVRNYDWKDPNRILVGIKDTIKEASVLSAVILNDEGVPSQDEADRIAGIRADQLISQQSIGKGKSTIACLHAGTVFTMFDHPTKSFNIDYMVTNVEHEGSQEAYIAQVLALPMAQESEQHEFYSNSFTCVKANVNYHPERKTRRTVISGMINAFIDGDDAKAPILDSYGRYKVLFPFDISGRGAGKASCWIRRTQEQVGKDSGMSFPLLPGTEVTISFMNGNPDRPVITGALANGETGSMAGPGNKNFSGIRTPGGAQMSFDNDHHGISLTGSGGSGIKLGSGSESYLQSDTHVALNLASQTCSGIAGYCSNNLSGFKQTTIAKCGDAVKYIFGILSLVCSQATNILDSLASSSSDAETSNDLSWGGTATKIAAELVGLIQDIYNAKQIPAAGYNVQIQATKSNTSQTTQCFPSTTELVANIVIMLLGSLGEVGTDIADGVCASNDADSQETGDVESYKNKLLEAMRAIYDRKGYVSGTDFEKFKYEGDTIGEYYSGGQSSPCSYYAVTTEALTSIINAVHVQIQDTGDKIQSIGISLTSSDLSEENRETYLSDLNQELINSQQKKSELESLQKLSKDLDDQYGKSCVGDQTAADYYEYEKQESIRNATSNSVSALLPEIGTTVAMALWANDLKKKNLGGIFINAGDKNINLHAKTYIGQHAERGIYLNTLKAIIIPKGEDQCGDWGSPLKDGSGVDDRISNIFDEIKNEVADNTTKKHVSDIISTGHQNRRKSDKLGDTIETNGLDSTTTFIAARTHLSYTKASSEFHYLDQHIAISSPFFTLTTTFTDNVKKYTKLKMDDERVDLHTTNMIMGSYDSDGKDRLYELQVTSKSANLGVPYADGDDSYHGIVITDEKVAVNQKKTGAKTSLILEDNKITLAIDDNNHLTIDGKGKTAVLASTEVQIAGVVFQDGQITKAKGGNLIFGNNDIKISGVSSAEDVKSNVTDEFKSAMDILKEAKENRDTDDTNGFSLYD